MGYCGVGVIGQYLSANEYANCLFFIVSKRFNILSPLQNSYDYSEKQIANYRLIKSLYKSGFGDGKIAQILNERGLKTKNDKTWSNGLVHSVLKRYSEQRERLAFTEEEYSLMRGRMWKEFTK